MTDIPVEAIRQSNRYEMTINRKKLKNEENDLRRSLADLRLNDIDLTALANKLKTKSEVNAHDLQVLKNILIQDEKNINVVLNTQGALRGLVREISGVDVNRQVEAAGCLCNLSLADLRGCLTIIRDAGAYLVAALDSQNLELALCCAWALGNLCGAGAEAARRLGAGGAAARLCARLHAERERLDANVDALTLFAHAMGDELSKEHLDLMVESVGSSDCTNAFRLYHILSCHKDFSDPQWRILTQITNQFPDLMREHHKSCRSCRSRRSSAAPAPCCRLAWGVRALGNAACARACLRFLAHIHASPERRRDFLDLLEDPRMKISMMWLLGNVSWQGWKQESDSFLERYDFDREPRVLNAAAENARAGAGELAFQMFADEEPQLAMITENEE